MDLTGKTAVITGSGRGIGSAIAVELGRGGANVAVNLFLEFKQVVASLASGYF